MRFLLQDKDYWWGRIGGDASRGCYAFVIKLPRKGCIYLHWHVGPPPEGPYVEKKEWPLFRWRSFSVCFPNREWSLPFFKYYPI